jgi:hypothetical protein
MCPSASVFAFFSSLVLGGLESSNRVVHQPKADAKATLSRPRTDSGSGRRHTDLDIDSIMIPADFAPSKCVCLDLD